MYMQTDERVKLYGKVETPGDPIPINVEPFAIPDATPDDTEIRAAVKDGLKRGRAGGRLTVQSQAHLKDVEEEEKAEREGATRVQGLGDRWRIFVRLARAIWETGTIPRQMMWAIVILLPRGGGNFRAVGLLKPFWKVLDIIMDNRLHVVEFHNCLHGSIKGKGCGTAGIEAKLVQQLAFIEQHPLYVIFIDLKKAYDAMDRERCREILVGYGMGPNMPRLIMFF